MAEVCGRRSGLILDARFPGPMGGPARWYGSDVEIGIFSGAAGQSGFDAVLADAKSALADGFPSYWLPQIVQQADAMTIIGALAEHVSGLRFGTSVVPTYPRHPMVMAEQAKTVSMLTKGQFTLGIGLSHQPVVEGMWGYSFDKPVRHAREYLDALMPLLAGEPVRAKGETITARGSSRSSRRSRRCWSLRSARRCCVSPVLAAPAPSRG